MVAGLSGIGQLGLLAAPLVSRCIAAWAPLKVRMTRRMDGLLIDVVIAQYNLEPRGFLTHSPLPSRPIPTPRAGGKAPVRPV